MAIQTLKIDYIVVYNKLEIRTLKSANIHARLQFIHFLNSYLFTCTNRSAFHNQIDESLSLKVLLASICKIQIHSTSILSIIHTSLNHTKVYERAALFLCLNTVERQNILYYISAYSNIIYHHSNDI